MAHSVFDSVPHKLTKLVWAGIGITVLAAILGAWGMWRYENEHHGHADALSVVYHTLQLFILHAPHLEHPANWQIHAGRLLSALFVAWALVKGITVLLGTSAQLQLTSWKGRHVIVCGLGHLGKQIATEFRHRKKPVLVIDADEQKAGCAPSGAAVAVGDACDVRQLCRAGVTRARHLIAVCDDVQTNVAIAVTAGEILQQSSPGRCARLFGWSLQRMPSRIRSFLVPGRKNGEKLTGWLFVPDAGLRQLLKEQPLFPDGNGQFQVNVRGLDLFSLAARQVLAENPLDFEPIHENSSTTVHLVIVGFGPAGQRLALHAARIGHFANAQKVKITVLDRSDSRRLDEFRARYPKFETVVDLSWGNIDLESSNVVAPILDALGTEGELITVALCWDSQSDTVTSEVELFRRLGKDDAVNLTLALNLFREAAPQMPRTLLFQTRECGFAKLFRSPSSSHRAVARVHVFGTIEQTCSQDALMHETTDTVARALHKDWYTKEANRPKKPGEKPKATFKVWEELDEQHRESNRNAADHIPVKLRAIDYDLDDFRTNEPSLDSLEKHVELLARMEHARWCAEHYLLNYEEGPRDEPRKHPDLVEWEKLGDGSKEYDRGQVRVIPAATRDAKLGIYRIR